MQATGSSPSILQEHRGDLLGLFLRQHNMICKNTGLKSHTHLTLNSAPPLELGLPGHVP